MYRLSLCSPYKVVCNLTHISSTHTYHTLDAFSSRPICRSARVLILAPAYGLVPSQESVSRELLSGSGGGQVATEDVSQMRRIREIREGVKRMWGKSGDSYGVRNYEKIDEASQEI
jgi:hypothetical protein